MTTETTPKPMTVAQAAEILAIHKRVVIYHIDKGHLRAEKFGEGLTSAWMVDAADVEQLRVDRAARAARKAEKASDG